MLETDLIRWVLNFHYPLRPVLPHKDETWFAPGGAVPWWYGGTTSQLQEGNTAAVATQNNLLTEHCQLREIQPDTTCELNVHQERPDYSCWEMMEAGILSHGEGVPAEQGLNVQMPGKRMDMDEDGVASGLLGHGRRRIRELW